jgi:hypothetical protein
MFSNSFKKTKLIIFLIIFSVIFIYACAKNSKGHIFIEYPEANILPDNYLLNMYRESFPDSNLEEEMIPQMIRGERLIYEINNYFNINNEYPKFHTNNKNELINVYKKAFPDENIKIGGFSKLYTQPYYTEYNFSNDSFYGIYYNLGWDKKYLWDWIYEYDSRTGKWTLGFIQY